MTSHSVFFLAAAAAAAAALDDGDKDYASAFCDADIQTDFFGEQTIPLLAPNSEEQEETETLYSSVVSTFFCQLQ